MTRRLYCHHRTFLWQFMVELGEPRCLFQEHKEGLVVLPIQIYGQRQWVYLLVNHEPQRM